MKIKSTDTPTDTPTRCGLPFSRIQYRKHVLLPVVLAALQLGAVQAGVTKTVTVAGDGTTFPKNGQTVTVHYRGWLKRGGSPDKPFDSSWRKARPFKFQVGRDRIIRGWEEAVKLMSLGEKARLDITSDLAFGARGAGGIPPNADVMFEVELLAIDGLADQDEGTPTASKEAENESWPLRKIIGASSPESTREQPRENGSSQETPTSKGSAEPTAMEIENTPEPQRPAGDPTWILWTGRVFAWVILVNLLLALGFYLYFSALDKFGSQEERVSTTHDIEDPDETRLSSQL